MSTDDGPAQNLGKLGEWMVRRFWLFFALLVAVVISMVLITLFVFEHKASGFLGIVSFIVITGLSLRPILKARTERRATSATEVQ